MKIFALTRLLPLLGLAVFLSGCGDGARTPTATGDGPQTNGKPRIALIMKSLANEFFLTMENGARAHQAEHRERYDLIAQGIKDEQDVNRQIQLVEQMMAQGVDAIVIAPADSKALVSVLRRAQEAGVVVVNIDNKLDDEVLTERGMQVPFVGPDNRAGARMVAEYLVARLEPGAPVAIVEGIPNAFNAVQRKLGFEDALQAGGMRILSSQTANWEMSQANQVVAGMINEHPGLQAILCANDNMALGAVSALRAAGRLQDVHVVGFDNISAVQELLQRGDILATADQHADKLAVFGIEFALDLLEGNEAPDDQETPVDLITAEAIP